MKPIKFCALILKWYISFWFSLQFRFNFPLIIKRKFIIIYTELWSTWYRYLIFRYWEKYYLVSYRNQNVLFSCRCGNNMLNLPISYFLELKFENYKHISCFDSHSAIYRCNFISISFIIFTMKFPLNLSFSKFGNAVFY